MVKAGLVLGLFGGSQKFVDSKVDALTGAYIQSALWMITF
jgi:hypothetical protein